nr:rhodanese-like domain-containing protein [Streptomyces chartreusis]
MTQFDHTPDAPRLPGHLVEVAWLAENLGKPGLTVLDATVSLPSPRYDGDYRVTSGRAGWVQAHIPGSQHADLTGDFCKQDAPYHFAMPDAVRLSAALASVGVGATGSVVVYDRSNGNWAARLWWMLRSLSVPAAVLNGGLAAWMAAGHRATDGTQPPAPALTSVTGTSHRAMWTNLADVTGMVHGQRPGTLVCALPSSAFAGTTPTRYSRRGHIPGSLNLPATALLDQKCRMLPVSDLAARVNSLLDGASSPIVVYCGGGIAAAHTALALTLLGRNDVSLYDGSLEEWSKDPSRPMETSSLLLDA